jgi:hypothetical protein
LESKKNSLVVHDKTCDVHTVVEAAAVVDELVGGLGLDNQADNSQNGGMIASIKWCMWIMGLIGGEEIGKGEVPLEPGFF